MDVTYEMTVNDKKVTGTIASKYGVKAHGTNDYQTIIFDKLNVPSDTTLLIKFTANNNNDGAIINFIGINGTEKVKTSQTAGTFEGTSSEANTTTASSLSAGKPILQAVPGRATVVNTTPVAPTVDTAETAAVEEKKETTVNETEIAEEAVPSPLAD